MSGVSKKSKDCVTVLVACNMTGSDKHRLLVIGKSDCRDPCCFQGKKGLPVSYNNSQNAWITSDIFKKWLLEFNCDMTRKKRHILLLLDNYLAPLKGCVMVCQISERNFYRQIQHRLYNPVINNLKLERLLSKRSH